MTGTPDPASAAGAHGTLRPLQAMGPGAEFDLIRRLMARWQDCIADIGDDAALLPPSVDPRVVSTDATVEGVHFRHGWLTPREIGARAAARGRPPLRACPLRTARSIRMRSIRFLICLCIYLWF